MKRNTEDIFYINQDISLHCLLYMTSPKCGHFSNFANKSKYRHFLVIF